MPNKYMNYMVDEGCFNPYREHKDDAGLELRSPVSVTIAPATSRTIDTGIHLEIPRGFCGVILPKSGLMVNHGLVSFGVVDCGYTGSIRVKIFNWSSLPYEIERGDKISQILILPVALPDLKRVDEFQETERGDNGFGSTGK